MVVDFIISIIIINSKALISLSISFIYFYLYVGFCDSLRVFSYFKFFVFLIVLFGCNYPLIYIILLSILLFNFSFFFLFLPFFLYFTMLVCFVFFPLIPSWHSALILFSDLCFS